MRISYALLGIILAFTPWNVRASKNSMSGTEAITTAAAAAAAARKSVARELRFLMSSNNNNSNNYEYKRNYITIIEPDNFVSLDPDGRSTEERIKQVTDTQTLPTSIGTSTIQNGKIYDPADIVIVNKPNGIEPGDFGIKIEAENLGDIIGQRYAGDRQPKTPIPVGDSAYFFHGECVATSALQIKRGNVPDNFDRRDRRELNICNIGDFTFSGGAFVITSHTCLLNLCLGGGGFDCISIYAGTSFVFDFGQQLNFPLVRQTPTLPPPYPATIIGGTGSFEGIEGTVQIATIAGSAGAFFNNFDGGGLQRFGFIVQSISVTSNMPLPTAP